MNKESNLNTPKTMLDIECWEATQFINLPFFLAVLRFSPLTRDSDTTKVFFQLMDKGLPLRFSEPGYCFDDEKIHKSDVKCALHRIDDALLDTNHPPDQLFADEIIKTEAGNEISLAGILIARKDVSDIFAQMGFESYPWSKVPWPTAQTDFEDFPIEDSKVSNIAAVNEFETPQSNVNQALNEWIEVVKNIKLSESQHIQRLTDIVKESPRSLDSDWIAQLWAAVPGESYEKKPFWQIRDDYKKQIESAVIGGELEAVVEIREPGFDDGYKEIADKNRIRKIKDGWLNGADVRLTIYREQFLEWLKKSKQWPVVDSCLLLNWLDSEPKANAIGVSGGISQDNGRESQFYVLVWRVYQLLTSTGRSATAQKVWDEIRYRHIEYDVDNIIDEATADIILWTSKYGNESRQKRTTFNKTLSVIKNNPPS